MEFHIPRMFSSNSGATKPIKKSQIAKAKGALPKHQFVHSTFSAAIEGRRRVIPRAHDLRIQREMEARVRARAKAKTRAHNAALSTILVERSTRNRKKRATMKDQRECKGSKHMWKPNRNGAVAGAELAASSSLRALQAEDAALAANLLNLTLEESRGGVFGAPPRQRRGRDLAQARKGRVQVVHPLDKFCEREKSINVTGPTDEGEELLVRCLKAGKKCDGFTKREFDLIEKTISKFDGIWFLRHETPKCVAMNLKSCSNSFGNLETGVERLTRRDRDMITRASGLERFEMRDQKDLGKRFKSCAIVGNAPSLAQDKFGAMIDKYDAVFRLNHVQGFNPERKYPKRSGTKTSFRLFSKLPSFSLATGNLKVKPTSSNEVWLFWHDLSRYYIPGAVKNQADAPIRMLSPFQVRRPPLLQTQTRLSLSLSLFPAPFLTHFLVSLFFWWPHSQINWQVKVYFALRREMVRLGLGPFQCPHNINSGLHAVLLAQNMCQKIGVFGLSYDEKNAVGGAHFGNKAHVMSKKHDWGFDTLVLRVLHLAKQSGLCTA